MLSVVHGGGGDTVFVLLLLVLYVQSLWHTVLYSGIYWTFCIDLVSYMVPEDLTLYDIILCMEFWSNFCIIGFQSMDFVAKIEPNGSLLLLLFSVGGNYALWKCTYLSRTRPIPLSAFVFLLIVSGRGLWTFLSPYNPT